MKDAFPSSLTKIEWESANPHQAVGIVNPVLCDSAQEMFPPPKVGSLACLGGLDPRH